jgi:uncharacterized phage protein (TIGR01671 family)
MKNREIKFRAWDEKRKKMIGSDYPDNWDNDKDEWYADTNMMDLVGIENISRKMPVMQYIGLKDKDGKEIYEGDIVRIVNKKDQKDADHMQGVGEVFFYENELDFRILKVNGHSNILTWGGTDFVEIIGNIYENPELLK